MATASTTARRRAPAAQPAPAFPTCAACGDVLFENLLGELLCLRPRCEQLRQVVGHREEAHPHSLLVEALLLDEVEDEPPETAP